MSHAEVRAVLKPVQELRLPFQADKRKDPAKLPTPSVLHLSVEYRQWDGPAVPFSEDFGKKGGQVYSRDGTDPVRSCNEVEVAKALQTIRDHAFWISSYAPSQIPAIWRPWTCGPDEAPAWLRALDRRVRAFTGRSRGGIPDVVAWNDRDPDASAIFVECKGTKESFKEGQEDWVAAALTLGLSDEQISVAVRQFVS